MAFVALGGGLGSALRFCVSNWLRNDFPWGTFIVNVTGCFLIGLLIRLLNEDRTSLSFLLLATGFCGGFTTFSAFGWETVNLLKNGQLSSGLGNIVLTLVCCLAAVIAGHELGKG